MTTYEDNTWRGMVVDCHTHAFPDELAPVALAKLAESANINPRGEGTVACLTSSMDRAGIKTAWVHAIATHPRQTESIRRWALGIRSSRLLPFPSVHPRSSSLEKDISLLAEDGFRGIKLHADYQDFFIDDPDMGPLYDNCRRLGLIVFFHVGDDSAFPNSDRSRPKRLAAVLDAYPGLTVVAAHGGGWRRWEEAEEFLIGRDIFIELSFTRHDLEPARLARIIKSHPPDKILFGTDYPWDDQNEVINYFFTLPLSDEICENILFMNAKKLLKLPL